MSGYMHTEFADGRWETLPLAGQMGNIGSEISRVIRWKTKETLIAYRVHWNGVEADCPQYPIDAEGGMQADASPRDS